MVTNETIVPQVEDVHTAASYNAMVNILTPDGKYQLEKDQLAARRYMIDEINTNTVFFHNLREKLDFLIENDYYEKEVFEQYDFGFTKSLYKRAYAYKFRFQSYIGANKFYKQYALKTFDGTRYLERFEDRVVATALYIGQGNKDLATRMVDEIMSQRFQPATPTFLNAGRKQRGEPVSCYLSEVADSMEAIGAMVTTALQLSKRGGGVSFLLSNLREYGAPIKKMKGQSSGVIPVMKILEDTFSYANQLGARKGAGAVYLHAHHPDILAFLDTKRENADEKVRIKTLSLGVIIPDITFELAKNNEPMYLFSPYDIERIYGVPFSDIDFTAQYRELVDNPHITKKKISARDLIRKIAETQFESGYPYVMFEDNVNRANPIEGKVKFSNLCVEILQVSTQSTFNPDNSYDKPGRGISCNLGSLNIANALQSPDFGGTIETAIRALSQVSDMSNIESAPDIQYGNSLSHSVGLGQMNLHGFFGKEHIYYDSPEAVDFTTVYFSTVLYYALRASNKLAREKGETFYNFENSKYATGEFFDKYLEKDWSVSTTERVRELFANYPNFVAPTISDWEQLKADVMEYGLYNQNLLAVPPTGSISYINHSTSSIHPVSARIEKRQEGKIGTVFYPQPYLTNDNVQYYQDAYEMRSRAVIDVYAAATEHTDQGLSLTMFYDEEATIDDVAKALRYAHKKGIKTFYYARTRQKALAGMGLKGMASSVTVQRGGVATGDAVLVNDGDVCVSCSL